MKNLKKLLVLSFSVMFGLTMAACDGNAEDSNSNSSDTTSSEVTPSESEPTVESSTPSEEESSVPSVSDTSDDPSSEDVPSDSENEHTHTYSSEVTLNPTCTEEGVLTYTCECGDSYEEPIPKANHDLTYHERVDKTCFTKGNVEYWTCGECKGYFLDSKGTQETTAADVVIAAGHGEFVHHPAKEATCDENGNVEHWICPDCENYYLDAEGKTITNASTVTIVASHGNLTYHTAVAATCTENGNVDYWVCDDCGDYFSNSLGTTEVAPEDVIIHATHKTLVRHDAKDATCYEDGNTLYWYCNDCEKYFLDAAATQETTAADVVIAASHGTLVHHEAVAKTCDTAGNVEHWTCPDCNDYFLDAAATQKVTATDVVVAASHGTLVHHEAVAKTCDTAGNVEYWTCPDCNKYYLDAAATQETTAADVVIAASHGTLAYHAAVSASCSNDGNIEHWTCLDCNTYFLDEAGSKPTTVTKVTIKGGHDLTVHSAVAKTCTKNGNVEYWKCDVCEKYFLDAAATQETTAADVVIAASHGTLVHHEAVAKTCDTAGNVEYWTCPDCNKYYLDAAATQETTATDVVVAASHGTLVYHEAVAKTCDTNGNVDYWVCDACNKIYLDSLATQETTAEGVVVLKSHNLTHNPEVPGTCTANGTLEHWYCADCDSYYLDEACSNKVESTDDLVIESLGSVHTEFTHVEAVAATCTTDGNLEYWYCDNCRAYFLDAEGTTATTVNGVIVKAHHTLTHHNAVTKTCDTDGNLEYWTCDVCEKYFLDAAATQETTAADVVIAASHGTLVHHEAVAKTCDTAGNVEYWTCPDCNKYYLDAAATQETTATDVVIAASHGTLVHHEAVAKTCDTAGNVEYWTCPDCNKYYLDAAATQETTASNVVVKASHGTLVHHAAVAKTCDTSGNLEYWTCPDCEGYFLDAAAKLSTTATDVVIAASHGTLVHHNEVEATCEETGNVEYWSCPNCTTLFGNALGTAIIDLEDTVIPALGHTLADDYTISAIEFGGEATLVKECVNGCGQSVEVVVAAPTIYAASILDEETLNQYFTVNRSFTYTFEWVDGVLKNTNSEIPSSNSYIELTALTSGTFTFDVAIFCEASYDYLIIRHNGDQIYKSSGSNSAETLKTLTLTLEEGDVLQFDKKADNSVFHGGDYAKVYNMKFVAASAPATIEYVVVKFDSKAEETTVNPMVAVKGQTLESLPDASREGYYFIEWTVDADNLTPFDINTTLNENTTLYARWISVEDGCELLGTYKGKNVYGLEFINRDYTLTIDPLGNMTGQFTGTITGFDPETNIVTWTDGTTIGYFVYDEVTGTIASALRIQETLKLGTDFYVFTRANESLEASAIAFYDENNSLTIKLIEWTIDGTDTVTLLIKDNQIYPNVTYSSLFTENPVVGSMKTITDVVVKDAKGNVLVKAGYNGSKLVALDDAYGVYTNAENTLKVSGIESISLNDATGTYVYEDSIIKATIDGTYYHITLDGSTYTATIPMTNVVFDSNEGSVVEGTSINTTMPIGTLPETTKDGYVFMGWFDNEECAGDPIDATYAVTGETLTLYAYWLEEVEVTFDTDEGSEIDSIISASGLPLDEPVEPTKEGYRFDGYYTDETYTEAFSFANGVTEDTIVYVKWVKVWTVTINPNNGDENPTVVIVDNNTNYEIPEFILSGSDFVGWYTTATFDDGTEYVSGTAVTSDVTVYGKWATGKYTNNAANFLDSFDSEGKYIASINFEGTYPWTTVSYADQLWMVSSNQGIGSTSSEISFTMAKNAEVSFSYIVNSEYRWDYLTVYINGTEKFKTKDLASSNGVDFTDTYTAILSAGDVIKFAYSKDGSGNQGQDAAFVGQFVFADLAQYEIVLNYNDELTANETLIVDQGVNVTLPTPTRDGYVFKGWVNGETNVGTSFAPDSSATLVATWAPVHEVTLVLNNGNENIVVEVEDRTPLNTTDPKYTGYTFVGWYTTATFDDGTKYENSNITANITFYAKWIDTPDYVGEYMGAEVWGNTSGDDGNLAASKSLTISSDFAMSGNKSGTIDPSSHNETTGELSFTSGSNTYKMLFVQQGEYSFVLVNYTSSATDPINSTDWYVFVQGATSATGSSANQYIWDSGKQRIFSLLIDDTTTLTFYINATTNEFYGGVSIALLDGTVIEPTFAGLNVATSLVITDVDGNVVKVFAKEGVEYVPLDGTQGTYTGTLGTIVLDGAGGATVADVAATYIINESVIEIVVNGMTKTITLSEGTYVVVTDSTAGTYTGENGTFISNGDGTATLDGVSVTYIKNGDEVTYTIGETSTTILLNADGTYSGKSMFAGYTFTGTYYSEWDEYDTTLKIVFDDSPAISGFIYSGYGTTYYFNFTGEMVDNVLTLTITSAIDSSQVGKTVTFTLDGQTLTVTATTITSNVYTFDNDGSATCSDFVAA